MAPPDRTSRTDASRAQRGRRGKSSKKWKRGRWRILRQQRRRWLQGTRAQPPRAGGPPSTRRDWIRAVRDGISNPYFRVPMGVRGETTVTLPTEMNLGSARLESLNALIRLREAIVYGSATEVFVNLEPLDRITEAMAVILYAELQRCIAYRGNRVVGGNLPKAGTEAHEVLGGLGIHQFLGLAAPTLSDGARKWFQVRTDRQVAGQVIGELYRHFEPLMSEFVAVSTFWRSKFYRAMLDAMTNTHNHAYYQQSRHDWLPGRWWAGGLVNTREKSLRFVFWDQGLGIPRTIRRKGVRGLIQDLTWSDARLIAKAVEEGSSRFRNRRRGHGLFALQEMIDIAPSGDLQIISRRGAYAHRGQEGLDLTDMDSDLHGTLLIWTLRKEGADASGP